MYYSKQTNGFYNREILPGNVAVHTTLLLPGFLLRMVRRIGIGYYININTNF